MAAPTISGSGIAPASGYSPRRLASYAHAGDRLYIAGYGNHTNMTSAQFNGSGLGSTVADVLHSTVTASSLKLWSGTPADSTANADVITTNFGTDAVAAFSVDGLASVGTIQTAQGVTSPATITGSGGDADTAWLCLLHLFQSVTAPLSVTALSHTEVFAFQAQNLVNFPIVVAMKATGTAPAFSVTHNQAPWTAILIPLQGAGGGGIARSVFPFFLR